MKTASHAWPDRDCPGQKKQPDLTAAPALIVSEIKSGFSATRLHVCLMVFSFCGWFKGLGRRQRMKGRRAKLLEIHFPACSSQKTVE